MSTLPPLPNQQPRGILAICLATTIALGLLSRLLHTGLVVFDKYLGDTLYAAMIYLLLRYATRPATAAAAATVIMTALELFQLTLIPAHLLTSDHLIVRLSARLLGTSFSPLDLLAYALGIAGSYLAARYSQPPGPHSLQ